MNKPIIIGAGIAGLSAANYLVDNGVAPIIIEADTIGREKVCGEFFSPEAVPYLKKWGVPLIYIKKANFFTPENTYSFDMPQAAGSVARSICELKLAEYAKSKGAQIFTNTCVKDIVPAQDKDDTHYIKLSTRQNSVPGEATSEAWVETNKLIIATGRIPTLNNTLKLKPKYTGIKAHFKIPPFILSLSKDQNELHMFTLPGAYMGVTYVNETTVNICCLAKNSQSPETIIQEFIKRYPILSDINASNQFTDWVTAQVPDFGKKQTPNWPNTYFIGDATATIFPASGNGLAMGLTSGVMAAEHLISGSTQDFKNAWTLRYKQRLEYAKILNFLFMHPSYANIGFKFANKFPVISSLFYKLTRD